MTDARSDVEMRTWRVHVPLGIAFGGLWLLTAFHLLVGMHREVFEWDGSFILSCAAPPLLPVVMLAAGEFAKAGLHLGILVLVALLWWFAARAPEARWRFRVAAAAVVACWIFFDFGLALAA